MIMHYLGLDHIGHKTGPQGPNMLPKQREMDEILKMVYEAMETLPHHSKTLLVLAGDHGMNAGGNHGGSGPGETEPALLFASPKFKTMAKRREYECPTAPKDGTEFHYYTKVEQSDVVPALAGLMEFPVSKNSLGVFIPELGGFWHPKQMLQVLHQNAKQLLQIIYAKYGRESFEERATANVKLAREPVWPCQSPDGDEETLVCRWAEVLASLDAGIPNKDPELAEKTIYSFLNTAQEAMSSTASSYDIPRMGTGVAFAVTALVLAITSQPTLWPPSFAGIFFALTSLLYGVMMFASSYVEEEQHFWYWLTPAWILFLVVKRWSDQKDSGHKLKTAAAGVIVLAVHRFAVRWNQTGQKHAGEPDIVHAVFPDHHIFMWLLVLATYIANGWFLHNRSFTGIFMPEITAFADVSLVFLGIVFKLNFTQADAPELVQGLALQIRQWSEPFDLVMQARAVFAVLALTVVAVVVLSVNQARTKAGTKTSPEDKIFPLPERLHHLLTLFLMTQTRGPNVPLFFGLELQRIALQWLLSSNPEQERPLDRHPSVAQVALSTLLFSHVYYFCMGGSNSISSLDLSNAYNGVADYNIAAVGVLLFGSNWAGPIWWCSAAVLLLTTRQTESKQRSLPASEDDRDWVMVEREKLREDAVAATKNKVDNETQSLTDGSEAWLIYIASMTCFIACGLIAVMAACTALRTHLFIWTVFSPKYLYSMAWSIGWHLVINVTFGGLLHSLRRIA
jgi:ethanolaminephosphotransferase